MRHLGRLALGSTIALLAVMVGCNSGDDAAPPEAAGIDEANEHDHHDRGNHLHPELAVKTSLGEFRIRLDAEHAPLTVENFLEYVDAGFYTETTFHQVEPGYMILGGGYTAELVEKTTRPPFRNEAHNGLKNRRGTIAMARRFDTIDSSTSQFFINLDDNDVLDHEDRNPEDYGFCVFGEVLDGLDVVERISNVAVEDKDGFSNVPVRTVMIESIERIR